jgi:hypothetical protein
MKKVKNSELLVIDQALKYLSEQNTSAWYQISRNVKKIKPHLTTFQESHQSILDKYASKDNEGNISVSKDGGVDFGKNKTEADKLWKELLNEEINVEFYEFSVEKFGDSKLDPIAIEPLLDVVIQE